MNRNLSRIASKTKHLVVVALIFVSGCAVYYPQPVDIPLIKEKGDIRVDAGFFIAPGSKEDKESGTAGGYGTFSMGVTNFIAAQAYINIDVLGRSFIHGALGLFKGFENNTVIELYGGYGGGTGFSFGDENDGYNLAFSQFNIGKTGIGKAHIDYGLGLKAGYIRSYYGKDTPLDYRYQNNGWIVEPSIFFRIGGKRVKFCTKVNYLWTETISSNYYFPVIVSGGINLNF